MVMFVGQILECVLKMAYNDDTIDGGESRDTDKAIWIIYFIIIFLISCLAILLKLYP